MDDGDIDPKQKAEFFRNLKYRSLLNEWYGPSYTSREISAFGSKPRLISDLLGDVTRQVFAEETSIRMRLAENWAEVVGPGLSAMCSPGVLDHGVLTIEMRHSAYRKELENAFDLILALTNRYLGKNYCREVRLEAANRRNRKFRTNNTTPQ